jgi:branched-chain amino acid aminotransferase
MNYPIRVEKTLQSKLSEVDFNNLPFGKIFSDHMFIADYKDGQWQDLRIEPFANLSLHPATSCFHYGQAIFEGLKAQRDSHGNILIFRPDQNAERINLTAERMAMPEVPKEMFLQAIDKLLSIDHQWVPSSSESSLYIRPFMIATDEYVGIKESDTYKFIIFTSPVGAYYSAPVKVFISEEFIRAFPGGTGFAKCAGNYAATLYPMHLVKKQGFDQLLWLDGVERKYLQESGTMNVFFQINNVLITPPLDEGTILNGVTRDSVITLARQMNVKVEERKITTDEIFAAIDKGELQDAFGAGTAATIAPIIQIGYRDKVYQLPPVEGRELSNTVKKTLSNIKMGILPDTYHWIRTIQQEALVH